ncbi:MAG: M23 family metallopeptidase [Sulfitobacter sp.]
MIKRAIFALLSLAMPAMAGDFSLSLPIDCDLGSTCHIQQFVDHDPGPDAADFTCQNLSYDGHQGTDFALPNLAQMHQGVDVLAAAGGVVAGLRDGMPDTGWREDTAETLAGRECGNGVLIRHTGGWETQYCHMKQGSITVQRGASVAAGDVLGQVGMSGRAQFPHVHLSLRQNGQVVDPFAPGAASCGAPARPGLWKNPPAYTPGALITVGLSDGIPEYAAIKAGLVPAPTRHARALVIWAYGYGFRAGDAIALSLTGPKGAVISETLPLPRAQAQAFRATGKKSRRSWPKGSYHGAAILLRNGVEIDSQRITLSLD